MARWWRTFHTGRVYIGRVGATSAKEKVRAGPGESRSACSEGAITEMSLAALFSRDEPRFTDLLRRENLERSIYRVTEHVNVLVLGFINRVEKSILVGVGEHQLPRVAAVVRFVETRQIA